MDNRPMLQVKQDDWEMEIDGEALWLDDPYKSVNEIGRR
jgi:hypothetical protein